MTKSDICNFRNDISKNNLIIYLRVWSLSSKNLSQIFLAGSSLGGLIFRLVSFGPMCDSLVRYFWAKWPGM